MSSMNFCVVGRVRVSLDICLDSNRSTGCPRRETFRMDIRLRVSRLVQFFTGWVFESSPAYMNNFGNNGDGNFLRQYGADIQTDGHVDALEPFPGNALAFELFCDRPDFSFAADHSYVACVGLSRPAKNVLIFLMPPSDDD